MASTRQVLRLKRTDHKSEHLLVNITRDGTKDLDLKLVATDRESLFRGSLKESGVKSLQSSNFSGDLGEWKAVLSFALLHKTPDGPRPDFLQGVETVSSISDTTVTITLRKNIDGITQRLGTIKLEQNDDEEVQVFDWVDSAVAASDDLRAQLETLQESATSQQEQVTKLTKELDNLVKAKKEHEDELLSKFAALLNAKKLKIRDQQRLLNGAKVDPEAADEVSTARVSSSKGPRRAGTSRAGKRKANGSSAPVEEEAEDDQDGDGQTEDGTENAEEDEERRRQETPETDEGEATEDDEGTGDASGLTTAPNDSQTTRRTATRQSQRVAEPMEVDETSTSLPRRGKGRAMAKEPTPPPTSTNNADEDDETDDEL